jgi:hypothetical protein
MGINRQGNKATSSKWMEICSVSFVSSSNPWLTRDLRYIVCDSSAEGFWNGLRNSLPCNTSDMSLELLLLSHWPNLKAVIGRVGVVVSAVGPPMYPVWILAENALEPKRRKHKEENSINTILRLIHAGSASSNMTKNSLDPLFVTQHQFEIATDSKALDRTISSKVVPDATLTDEFVLGLDFYIVESRTRPANELPGLDKARWIWRLCCLSRDVIRNLILMSVECERWHGIIHWLYMVGFLV